MGESGESTFTEHTVYSWQDGQILMGNRSEVDCAQENLPNPTQDFRPENFCKAVWDGLNCWPATLAGESVGRPCSEVMGNHPILGARSLSGSAYRACSTNGSWAAGGYSDYSHCLQQIRELLAGTGTQPVSILQTSIPYVILSGSILSVICLVIAICVYIYLKSLYLDRLKILLQMMIALLLKSILWIIMILPKALPSYFEEKSWQGWACKALITSHFYSLLATASWMIALGHYLNRKLMKIHLRIGNSSLEYMLFCWAVPMLLVITWATLMAMNDESDCWLEYTGSNFFYIIAIPMLIAFVGTLLYLGNILRTVVSRINSVKNPSQRKQIQRARTDIIILCPLLGLHNMLFFYNPGGDMEVYYMFYHALCQSIQGTIVAFLSCFISADVYKALWKKLKRRSNLQHRQCEPNRESRLIRPRSRKCHNIGKKVHFLDFQKETVFTLQYELKEL